MFALNVGKKIIQTLKNEVKCINCQGKHASNDKEWKEKEIQRLKAERWISNIEDKKQMDIFNPVKTTYAQTAAATKPVVKTVTVETQTEMTWPDCAKQPKKCAVEKQTTKFRFICCFTSRSTARVILRWVVYRWRKPVHTAL